MKKKFPLPLKINCEGLSRKLINDLADQLRLHFRDVQIWADGEITCRWYSRRYALRNCLAHYRPFRRQRYLIS